VQRALLNALFNNPDAQAALQRCLAMQGLSLNLQHLQNRDIVLPRAVAAGVFLRSAAAANTKSPVPQQLRLRVAVDFINNSSLSKNSASQFI
jgi:hypothetical protein